MESFLEKKIKKGNQKMVSLFYLQQNLFLFFLVFLFVIVLNSLPFGIFLLFAALCLAIYLIRH